MWPFKKKKEETQEVVNHLDFELIPNNHFLTNTSDCFNIPNWYVSGVIFKSDKTVVLYIKDGILEIDNKLTSTAEILRKHKDIFNFKISYVDGYGFSYNEIFEDSRIVSVVRSPINYSDSNPSLMCVEIKYETIDYYYQKK